MSFVPRSRLRPETAKHSWESDAQSVVYCLQDDGAAQMRRMQRHWKAAVAQVAPGSPLPGGSAEADPLPPGPDGWRASAVQLIRQIVPGVVLHMHRASRAREAVEDERR